MVVLLPLYHYFLRPLGYQGTQDSQGQIPYGPYNNR